MNKKLVHTQAVQASDSPKNNNGGGAEMTPVNPDHRPRQSQSQKKEYEVALARVDEKCRVVIPKRVRSRAGIKARTVVLATGSDSVVFLKKVRLVESPLADPNGGLVVPTVSPFRRPDGVRDLIIWALAQRRVLSSRKLYNIVKRSRGRISFQGIWKQLQHLMQEGVVLRVGLRQYTLDKRWLDQLRIFCDTAEDNHRTCGQV